MRNADMPAMPQSVSRSEDGAVISSCDFAGGEGLTKREYFAAMAMQGLLSGPHAEADCGIEGLAHDAVLAADKLLAELEKANA